MNKCLWCGNDCNGKYCSRSCANYGRYNKDRKYSCKQCGIIFERKGKSIAKFCSVECKNIFKSLPEFKKTCVENFKKSMKEKYGVDHPSKLPDFASKLKSTKKLRYGDENYVNVDKCKNTKKDRYGNENYNNPNLNKQTKKDRYGNENYNNRDKFKVTMYSKYNGFCFQKDSKLYSVFIQKMKKLYNTEYALQNEICMKKAINTLRNKYGVDNPLKLLTLDKRSKQAKKTGVRTDRYNKVMLDRYGTINYMNSISNPQKKLYKYLLKMYPAAKLEYYLKDIGINVDVYIPELNKVYELYGDYWHCHEKIFENENTQHPHIKQTAKEIREKDKIRENKIKNAGYVLEVIWESELKKFILDSNN